MPGAGIATGMHAGLRFGSGRRAFEVVAHRGARVLDDRDRIAPENTLPCFREAAKRGAAVELDVIATADGQLLVHHDDETGKIFTLPGGEKPAKDLNAPEVARLRLNAAGHEADVNKMLGETGAYRMNPAFANLHPDTLQEVIQTLPDTHLYIELKTYDRLVKNDANNQLEARVAKLIRERDLYKRVTVISFSPASIRKMKALDPRIKTGLDIEIPGYIRRSAVATELFVRMAKRFLGVDSIHPSYETTTPRLVKAAHRQNLRIVPWVYRQTVEEEKAWFHKLRAMGADGMITNAIDAIQSLLKAAPSSDPKA